MADPFDKALSAIVTKAVGKEGVLQGDGVKLHDKGTVVCIGMPIYHPPWRYPSFERPLLTHGCRRTAILLTHRIQLLPFPSPLLHRHQHVRAPRSTTFPRSGNRICSRLHVHRLRQLARHERGSQCRNGLGTHGCQRPECAESRGRSARRAEQGRTRESRQWEDVAGAGQRRREHHKARGKRHRGSRPVAVAV